MTISSPINEGNQPLVLVADDDPQIRILLSKLLQKLGCASLVVEDGAAAVLAAAGSPELACVLLDVEMPTLDGIGAARALATRTPALPIVLMSGLPSAEVVSRLGVLAVAGVLQKPFGVGQLRDLINRVVRWPSLERPVALLSPL